MVRQKTIFIAHNWSCDTVASISYFLAIELSKEHKVVFLNAKGERKEYQKINENLEVYDWPHKRPTKLEDFLFLRKLILKYRPDTIVAHFSAVNVSILCSKLLNVKERYSYYHTVSGAIDFDNSGGGFVSAFSGKLQRLRKKIVYHSATGIIAATKFAVKDIVDNFGISRSKICTIYHGHPDTSKRNQFTSVSIGFLGRLDYTKGADVLIAAVGSLINRNINVTLELAGRGKEQAKLEEMVNSNGWEKQIKFIGVIPYSSVNDFLCRQYMMVVPSRLDNPSMVLFESFCTQTPVIGAAAGAIPEVIDHNKTGLLFKTEDSNDLAEKILTLIENRSLRDELALAGRKKYEAAYTIERNVQEVKRLILNGLN